MNAPHTAPFRDARYAPRALRVERRGDALILRNPMPYSDAVRTVTEPLARWAAEAPERVWLAERDGAGWRTVTFGEAQRQVAALAGGLAGLGLARGRPLLILARNGVDHALISYGAMSLGAPIAPVSPQYGLRGADLTRLQHAVERLKPAAVYVDDAEAFGGALAAPFLAGLPTIVSRSPRPGDIAFVDLLASAPVAPVTQPDDIAKLLLTSGSTGKPKAVLCTHANIALNAAQIEACYADPDPPVLVNSAPWSHSLGANAILHMVLHRGGTLYIDAGQPVPGRFDETVRNLREVATTYHNMVPAGWAMLIGELERDEALAAKFFQTVRVLQYGGASMAQSILDRVQAVAVKTVGERITFAAGYGATETGPTACNIHWLNARSGMVGLPTPGTAVKLVPAGEGGKFEIRVKGPQVSPGYLAQPEATEQAFDEDGFYRLGDAARLADPEDPSAGLVFDGRLVENFKLASGAFVAAGALRVAAVSAIGGLVSDAVVCGEGQEGVGLMLFLDAKACEAFGGPAREAIAERLRAFNLAAKGGTGRIARALILDGAPDAASGELTDKGYINQALARERRPGELARLFADNPDEGVMVF
ncbi:MULTISPECIES: feruloyl-CoA synthase [Caulobacter]|jgi:feruloyl-CoA synthase|uniref:Acyl-CoA synthetase (AMP-forming)/AMP-acid ligase II n=1 Tax=Caulobacter vibrioides OR37 TaxID=1292034 RepID=R0EGE3_CAUVI|nr:MULTISPECIES: feruloyl-CoA synthase [Caulobacter]ENZ80342.1 acyl-CoA synthetase (AMP-forming)/AMP-acid ligase II [Caulobacter vibrioides OR37]MBQ1561261.1 feruloyl-CoA synthase [Caulobacter sp.]